MKRSVFAGVAAIALLMAAGCMVTEEARTNTYGGGTGVKLIDRPLDAFTVLEGEVAGTVGSGIKASDEAVTGSYHLAKGLVTSDYEPDLPSLEKARKADERRRKSGSKIIEKIDKAKITINARLTDRTVLDRLGLYLVWATPMADFQVDNVWAEGDMVMLSGRDSTREQKVLVLNLYNGFARWQYGTVQTLDSRPTVNEGIVWVCAGSTIHAIDADMGLARWKTRVNFSVSSPIFTAGERQYVGSYDHAVYALQGDDRVPDWHFSTFGPISSMPAVDEGGVIYVGSEDGKLYAFGFTKRQNLWQVKTSGRITADIVQDAHNLYFGSEGFDFYCVSKGTGAMVWQFPAQGPIRTAPWLLNESTVLVRADDSALFALNRNTGEEKWHDSSALKPVAFGRFLYLLTAERTIKAVDPETGKAAWEESALPFEFIPANFSTDAITLCSKNGQVFLLQEKNGMNLKLAGKVAKAPSKEAAPAKEGAVGTPAAPEQTGEAEESIEEEGQAPEEGAAVEESSDEGSTEQEAPAEETE
ncbi:MAG TPA: PQQ-binding-like beta-propeller repeat protein [Planctomycetota bacterium]|nr:PQQ-binding-like beta-propeller repeat protein [Planctomycetota bacterium]